MYTLNQLILLASCLLIAAAQYPTFDDYLIMFNKTYPSTEYQTRKQLYQARIQSFASITDYTPGVNQRSDWTQEEINASKNLQQIPDTRRTLNKLGASKLGAAESLDWRTRNAVTSIKNQGSCGCCWAFATVAYAESKLIISGQYTAENINLSQQYMLECTKYSTCDGGYLQYAIEQVKTVPTQQKYPYSPYQTHSGICYANGITSGYIGQMFYSLSDSQLIDLLQTGPIAISISSVGWENYGSGVFRCSSTSQVDHAVLLVGYTASQWIVKNQWGPTWGQSGYIRVTRSSSNNCKIGTSAAILFGEKLYFIFSFILALLFAFQI